LTHFMFDIETLGTRPGSVILAIGVVEFDPVRGELGATDYHNLQVGPQEAAGLTTDLSTVAWWSEQGAPAKARLANPEPADPLTVLGKIGQFMRFSLAAKNDRKVWGHGATFDIVLLDRLFAAFDIETPWAFWNARDTRTLFDLTGTSVKREKGTHHYALDDAKRQAEAVCEAYHTLGLTTHGLLRRFRMAARKQSTGQFYDWREA